MQRVAHIHESDGKTPTNHDMMPLVYPDGAGGSNAIESS